MVAKLKPTDWDCLAMRGHFGWQFLAVTWLIKIANFCSTPFLSCFIAYFGVNSGKLVHLGFPALLQGSLAGRWMEESQQLCMKTADIHTVLLLNLCISPPFPAPSPFSPSYQAQLPCLLLWPLLVQKDAWSRCMEQEESSTCQILELT